MTVEEQVRADIKLILHVNPAWNVIQQQEACHVLALAKAARALAPAFGHDGVMMMASRALLFCPETVGE